MLMLHYEREKLEGNRQAQIDAAPSFRDVLQQHLAWINRKKSGPKRTIKYDVRLLLLLQRKWTHMKKLLEHGMYSKFVLELDQKEAERYAQMSNGCHCGGALHRSDYPRKLRGFKTQEQVKRISYCCNVEGCRKRYTPISVRFFGRRAYYRIAVILLPAMLHGIEMANVHALREQLGVDRRNLERWRQWWLVSFVASPFWRVHKNQYPSVDQHTMPLSLIQAQGFNLNQTEQDEDVIIEILKFFIPTRIGPCVEELIGTWFFHEGRNTIDPVIKKPEFLAINKNHFLKLAG